MRTEVYMKIHTPNNIAEFKPVRGFWANVLRDGLDTLLWTGDLNWENWEVLKCRIEKGLVEKYGEPRRNEL
jgi:hypothetical protein